MVSTRDTTVLFAVLCLAGMCGSLPQLLKKDMEKCNEALDVGNCTGPTTRLWYYDKPTNSCLAQDFSLCPGTKNYFLHKLTCDSLCIEKRMIPASNVSVVSKVNKGSLLKILSPCDTNVTGPPPGKSTKIPQPSSTMVPPGPSTVLPPENATVILPGNFTELPPENFTETPQTNTTELSTATTTEAPFCVADCLRPLSVGNCSEPDIPAYYYDQKAGSCKVANFTTCPGSKNYFRNVSMCEFTCTSELAREKLKELRKKIKEEVKKLCKQVREELREMCKKFKRRCKERQAKCRKNMREVFKKEIHIDPHQKVNMVLNVSMPLTGKQKLLPLNVDQLFKAD